MIPIIMAVGAGIGGVGTAIGGALGIGGAAAAGAATAGAATAGGLATAAGALAPAAAATGGFSIWQGLGLLSSAVSAIGSVSAGNAQADAMRLQATNQIIQGNAQSMEYQRQGLSVMRRVQETEATIRARGAAGGIDPFSGSAGVLGDLAFSRGADEYNWARDNASSAVMAGQSNASAYRSSASSMETAGYMNAGTSLLGGVAKFGSVGGFGQIKSLLTPTA
jgi:hypothetical protein